MSHLTSNYFCQWRSFSAFLLQFHFVRIIGSGTRIYHIATGYIRNQLVMRKQVTCVLKTEVGLLPHVPSSIEILRSMPSDSTGPMMSVSIVLYYFCTKVAFQLHGFRLKYPHRFLVRASNDTTCRSR
jgi:hypothetical protein